MLMYYIKKGSCSVVYDHHNCSLFSSACMRIKFISVFPIKSVGIRPAFGHDPPIKDNLIRSAAHTFLNKWMIRKNWGRERERESETPWHAVPGDPWSETAGNPRVKDHSNPARLILTAVGYILHDGGVEWVGGCLDRTQELISWLGGWAAFGTPEKRGHVENSSQLNGFHTRRMNRQKGKMGHGHAGDFIGVLWNRRSGTMENLFYLSGSESLRVFTEMKLCELSLQ